MNDNYESPTLNLFGFYSDFIGNSQLSCIEARGFFLDFQDFLGFWELILSFLVIEIYISV